MSGSSKIEMSLFAIRFMLRNLNLKEFLDGQNRDDYDEHA